MTEALERALAAAQSQLAASDYMDPKARAAVYKAERELAAARQEPWAERIPLDAQWDIGAPFPHLISDGLSARVICRAHDPDPNWDGTYVNVVSSTNSTPAPLLEFTFKSYHSIKLGGPNDEAMHGHPLSGRGLEPYAAHLVHNSPWIAEEEAISSVHPHHRADTYRALNHYFLAFHDETFEALAVGFDMRAGIGTVKQWLSTAVSNMTSDALDDL